MRRPIILVPAVAAAFASLLGACGAHDSATPEAATSVVLSSSSIAPDTCESTLPVSAVSGAGVGPFTLFQEDLPTESHPLLFCNYTNEVRDNVSLSVTYNAGDVAFEDVRASFVGAGDLGVVQDVPGIGNKAIALASAANAEAAPLARIDVLKDDRIYTLTSTKLTLDQETSLIKEIIK